MVEVLVAQVLVVPPFECAWLTGENLLLRDGKGCISFEVKGDNDVTIILKPQFGSRRWQHRTSGRLSPVEPNYTIILGSHRNSCLKIEKDGELCRMANNVPGSKLSSTSFSKYWVNYDKGSITVGCGEPDLSNSCCSWADTHPINDIQFVGLSAWDKHIGYRNIQVHPCLSETNSSPTKRSTSNLSPRSYYDTNAPTQSNESTEDSSIPTLVELCCQALLEMLNNNPSTICAVLTIADHIAPVIDGLRCRAIEAAAQQFTSLISEDIRAFQGLTMVSLRDILKQQSLACGEKVLFDAMMLWAGGCDALPPNAVAARGDDDDDDDIIDDTYHYDHTTNTTNINSENIDDRRAGMTRKNINDDGKIMHHRSTGSFSFENIDAASVLDAMIKDPPALPSSKSRTRHHHSRHELGQSSAQSMDAEQQRHNSSDIDPLLPHIRFPLMDRRELHDVMQHPLYSQSSVLQSLIKEAFDVIDGVGAGGDGRTSSNASPNTIASSVRADRLLLREPTPLEAEATARLQRRSNPPGCQQLIYMYDGDHNGVCWYLGTRYGTQQWVNPVLAGYLDARASSPISRGTDPRALFSGAFLRNNFAGPRSDPLTGELSSWWMIDLGKGHSLECNYYTLRHDASSNFLRSWSLQGSLDGINWVDVRRHEKEDTLKLPGQYASWAVTGAASVTPFRYFRILLLAPNTDALNPYHVCLSYIELYGNFYAK